MGMSLSMIPPCIVDLVARWCFLATLTASTITRSRSPMTRVTSPSLPMSLPAITRTRSPFLSFMSEHLRGKGDDAHEPPLAQLPAHRPEDAGTARLELLVDENGGVLVEADVAAVRTAAVLLGPHDDALHDLALLHGRAGNGVLHRGHEDVADARVTPPGATEDLDAQDLAGARVVGDAETGLLLNHWIYFALSRTSTMRQRFCFDIARVSAIRTRSPSLTSLVSSWA